MSGWWPYSCCTGGRCLQDLFNIARSNLVQFSSNIFIIGFVSVHVVHPYSSIDTITAWKKLRFILSDSSDFLITDNQSIAIHAFASHVFISFSVDETLLPGQVNLFTSFRETPFIVAIPPLWLKHCTQFWLHSHGGQCQTVQQGFGLSRCICQLGYVISIVRVCNSLYGVSSASCLFHIKTIFLLNLSTFVV